MPLNEYAIDQSRRTLRVTELLTKSLYLEVIAGRSAISSSAARDKILSICFVSVSDHLFLQRENVLVIPWRKQ